MKPVAKRIVEVKIQGRPYRIRAEGDDAGTVNRAAAILDETMERVRLRASTVDSVDIAVLAALNIANTLVAERETKAGAIVPDQRVAAMLELLEAALAPNGAVRR
jgi:cell division protein ZapA (FtsZ GTPase activity inhibitor)